jgi:hypothetical protein
MRGRKEEVQVTERKTPGALAENVSRLHCPRKQLFRTALFQNLTYESHLPESNWRPALYEGAISH